MIKVKEKHYSEIKEKIKKVCVIVETERLYRVKKEDLPKLNELLTECFAKDPLYNTLIPDEKIREKLMPKLFHCDLWEYFKECEIYSDSKELNSLIVVSDESERYNPVSFYLEEMAAQLQTDGYLIKEDPSLKTLYNFILGKDYLNSKWTEELHNENRLHIIYLAVRPSMQHHGISGHLLDVVLRYADRHQLIVSLETHNKTNLPLYMHHGFELYKTLNTHFGLNQYCMVRPKQVVEELPTMELDAKKG